MDCCPLSISYKASIRRFVTADDGDPGGSIGELGDKLRSAGLF